MAKRKKGMVNEKFQASFGVDAYTPDPYTGGKTVKTPLDNETEQEPMSKLDDKGSNLETKTGMMNEIMKVLRDSQTDEVKEVFTNIMGGRNYDPLYEEDENKDDTNVDIHIDGGDAHKDDEDADDEEKKDEEETKSEGFSLRNHILNTLYEEDEEMKASEEDEKEEDDESDENKDETPKEESYRFGSRYIWEDNEGDDNSEIKDEEEEDDEDDSSEEEKKVEENYFRYGNYLYEEDEPESDDDDDSDEEKKDDEDSDKAPNIIINDKPEGSDEVKSEMRRLNKDDLIIEYNIDNLFAGGNFSPKFRRKVKAIFESAVLANVNANMDYIHNKLTQSSRAEAKRLRNELVEEVDSYLSYVVENFLEENKLAVENGLRMEVYENFMHEMRQLFERHYISVPEEKVDMVDIVSEKLERAQNDLNEEIQRNINLRSEIENLKKVRIVESVTSDMPRSQRARLNNLAENIEYINEHDFADKLSDIKNMIIIESHDTPRKVRKTSRRLEETFANDYDGGALSYQQENSGLMDSVVAKIEQLNRK